MPCTEGPDDYVQDLIIVFANLLPLNRFDKLAFKLVDNGINQSGSRISGDQAK